MDAMMRARGQGWLWGVYALLAMLGAAIAALGGTRGMPHLVFGGAMLALIAAAGVVHARALRPGPDQALPSHAEEAAWAQIGMGLAAIMVLGGLSLGSAKGSLASYLLLAAYAVVIAFHPLYRRRFIEHALRHRDVPEDERDRAIRARGDYLSKRLLEFALVGLAIAWALASHLIRALDGVQVAALLLLPVLAANVAGDARVARLHWLDRR